MAENGPQGREALVNALGECIEDSSFSHVGEDVVDMFINNPDLLGALIEAAGGRRESRNGTLLPTGVLLDKWDGSDVMHERHVTPWREVTP